MKFSSLVFDFDIVWTYQAQQKKFNFFRYVKVTQWMKWITVRDDSKDFKAKNISAISNVGLISSRVFREKKKKEERFVPRQSFKKKSKQTNARKWC